MRIGIVSDTHLHRRTKLPEALTQGLMGVDLLLHLGDWISEWVADELEAIAPLNGVAGNNDGPEIEARFGRKKLLRVGNTTFGLIHGDGFGKTTEQRAFEAFRGELVSAVLFGHSHVPYAERRDGILLFNPGSPTDKRRQPRYSYGIIELQNDGRMEAQHFFFDSRS